jgi:hypothetical protein
MGCVALHSTPQRTASWKVAVAALALAASAQAADAAGVSGRVTRSDDPVARATVYAYRVVERSFEKSATDDAGRFLFEALPAGLYKIVAHKVGLPPAVLVLARKSADESQFVQVDLSASEAEPEQDFWSTRASVPGDVLRDLDTGSSALASAVTSGSELPRFVGEVRALASRAELAQSLSADSTGAELALRGLLGALRVDLKGQFERFDTASGGLPPSARAFSGESSSFRLGVAGEGNEFGFEGQSSKWLDGPGGGAAALDRYHLRYAGDIGDAVATTLQANFVDEESVLEFDQFVPATLPMASRWLTLQGGYSLPLGDTGTLRGGVRYRESELQRVTLFDAEGPVKYLDAWSRGDVELNPTYVVEYGLFSTFRDGRISVSPRGGLVLKLHPEWQASIAASRRFVVSDLHPLEHDFSPGTLDGALSCEDSEALCLEAEIRHGDGSDRGFELKSSWREYDRTVRLILQDDRVVGGDGLFFVPGDQLPELRASMRRRLGGDVLASWVTSYAEGGGGTFRAANRRSYENRVAYVSTAVDAIYEPTSTGIFVAFHRLDQRLQATQPSKVRSQRARMPATELERLELVVSQDLSQLFDLAQSWAVKVGMELVRGESFLTPIEEWGDTRRRITTGVAVRF